MKRFWMRQAAAVMALAALMNSGCGKDSSNRARGNASALKKPKPAQPTRTVKATRAPERKAQFVKPPEQSYPRIEKIEKPTQPEEEGSMQGRSE